MDKKFFDTDMSIEREIAKDIEPSVVSFTSHDMLERQFKNDAIQAAKNEIVKEFNRIAEPPTTENHGYVCDHWAPAIRIADAIDGKVLFDCEMMVIFKEDFPLAEKIKAKIVEKISSIQEEVYREHFNSDILG